MVAVKTSKEGAPQHVVGDLLQEMRIMQTIGPHPNVVAMLGVCVEKEPYLLIMEYVMYGKLLQHLRDHRSKQANFFEFSEGDAQGDEDSELTAKCLTKYAYGVAKGMEYIVSKGVKIKHAFMNTLCTLFSKFLFACLLTATRDKEATNYGRIFPHKK